MGLALVAAVRGYKCVLQPPTSNPRKKSNLLKALGAEVIVCPTAVEAGRIRAAIIVAKKLAREIPNSYYPNQYDNPSNPEAHYRTTGPRDLGRQRRQGHHFVCGVGTGGTISGVGKYLKEKKSQRQNHRRRSLWLALLRFVKTGKPSRQDVRCGRHRRGFFSNNYESENPG